jgi:flagellar basal body-associated protein FliL
MKDTLTFSNYIAAIIIIIIIIIIIMVLVAEVDLYAFFLMRKIQTDTDLGWWGSKDMERI